MAFSKRTNFKTKEQCSAESHRNQTCRTVQEAINKGMEVLALAQGDLLLGMEKLLAQFKKQTESI